jgi:Holliday junction DNA helicase RuvB
LVGATTRTGLLTAPLRSRFTLQTRLDYYTREQLLTIVARNAKLLNLDLDQGGAEEVARRARGTPRIVNNLLRFTRDYALERAAGKADAAVTAAALELLEIDQHGLDDMDHRFLRAMAQKHNGGPVGLSSIGASIGEDAHTLEEVHEPFLVQEGYVTRTPQGRVLSDKGWLAAGLTPPSRDGTAL